MGLTYVSDGYRRPVPAKPGAELARPFRPNFPAPQTPSGEAAAGRRFTPQMDAPAPQPMTIADIDRQAADNQDRAAASQKTISDAFKERDQKRNIPLFSKEGRQNHPIAYAIAQGASYGSKAGEVIAQQDEQERRAKMEQHTQDLQDERLQAQRDAAQAKRAAMSAPAPAGYVRDPTTGQVYKSAEFRPEEGAAPPAGQKPPGAGYLWVPGRGWEEPRATKESQAKEGAQPPKGEKPPTAASVWIPGKGWETDPTYEKPSNRHVMVGEVAAAHNRMAAARKRMTELDQLDAAMSGEDEKLTGPMKASHDEERKQINDTMESDKALIDDREQEMLGRTGPQDYTVEEWGMLDPKEQDAYLKAHPGFKPTRRGFDAAPRR